MSENGKQSRFGEVVEASVDRLTAQCHQLYEAPPLGTLVRAGDSTYGIVSGIATSALDPTRKVIARGADARTEADIYAEHPQLERLLRTDVTVNVVGHRDDATGVLRQFLPSQPPRIHTFLYACSPDEVRAFFGQEVAPRLDFVSLLIGFGPTADDVLAAALRQASTAFDSPREFLIEASRAIAVLLVGDTNRLNAIVRRLPINEVAR